MELNFHPWDEEKRPIKDDPGTIADTLRRLTGPEAASTVFRSDYGQTITPPRRPVAPDRKSISLKIVTSYGSSRYEKWSFEKFVSYIEAGFLVRTDGAVYKKWTRPSALDKAIHDVVKDAAKLYLDFKEMDRPGDARTIFHLVALSRYPLDEWLAMIREFDPPEPEDPVP